MRNPENFDAYYMHEARQEKRLALDKYLVDDKHRLYSLVEGRKSYPIDFSDGSLTYEFLESIAARTQKPKLIEEKAFFPDASKKTGQQQYKRLTEDQRIERSRYRTAKIREFWEGK